VFDRVVPGLAWLPRSHGYSKTSHARDSRAAVPVVTAGLPQSFVCVGVTTLDSVEWHRRLRGSLKLIL
jgi:hypothetical protein